MEGQVLKSRSRGEQTIADLELTGYVIYLKYSTKFENVAFV